MRLAVMVCLLLAGLRYVKAELEAEPHKSDITKLELVHLSQDESNVDIKESDGQRKRDSGYSYKRPDHSTLTTRARFPHSQPGHKGRIVNRHPSQINRPVTKYGPPSYQNSPFTKPLLHSEQHRDKFQHHSHFSQQRPNNIDGRPNGLLQQEVPSPIRHFDFAEPNPIASQNDKPFASNSANYLPPGNQKLPVYTTAQSFSPVHTLQNSQDNIEVQVGNLQSQNIVQAQEQQISDAALFLTENAQAIQQLYGAPATDQEFAPINNPFLGQTNQVQNPNAQFQNFESSSQSPQNFAGTLPSYASGTLSSQETLEHIQSLEKDRLIVQLQRALATQTQAQNVEAAGRYAQNQASFVQNQDFLASLGQQMKIHGLNTQLHTLNAGSGNTAFNQSPFLPGTTIGPSRFPLSYGISTTTQTPTTATATTTTGQTTVQPHQGTKGDGTSQAGASLPAPAQPVPPVPTSLTGFPVYGALVPAVVSGTGFVTNVPSYGPNYFTSGTIPSIQSAGSSPTHFGLPIPIDHDPKPASGLKPSIPSSTPSTTLSTTRPSTSPTPPLTIPLPVNPVASPLHPVVTPFHPIATPVQPVAPLHPVLPATPTHVHPAQTPAIATAGHPTYGLQTPVINPLLYKPIKPVYPLYYYPNVAYQLHKPALPSYPWSYAPSYAQTKPAQIWK